MRPTALPEGSGRDGTATSALGFWFGATGVASAEAVFATSVEAGWAIGVEGRVTDVTGVATGGVATGGVATAALTGGVAAGGVVLAATRASTPMPMPIGATDEDPMLGELSGFESSAR